VLKFKRRHLVWILPLVIVAFVFLLGVLADSWLESSGGRHMLQTELAKNLGIPVRLKGDYSLRLFPRLEIAGQDLEIGQPDGLDVPAFASEYSAVIELAPFIHREVKITSVRVRGGHLDLDRLSADAGAESQPAGSQMSLPQVASLEIGDFHVRLERNQKSLLIERLQVRGFRQGDESEFELQARVMNGQSEMARVKAHGGLILALGDATSRVDISEMKLDWGDTEIGGLSGVWEWRQSTSRLAGHMLWDQDSNSAELRLDLAVVPAPSGSFHARYRNPQLSEPASVSLHFVFQPGEIEMSQLDIEITGQSISGSGCLKLADSPSLHLLLGAETLDLDRIYSLDLPQRGDGTELPLDLAVELRIEEARFAGAKASDLVVAAGPEPACAGPDLVQ
jgi:hypothetical protein